MSGVISASTSVIFTRIAAPGLVLIRYAAS